METVYIANKRMPWAIRVVRFIDGGSVLVINTQYQTTNKKGKK